MFVSASLKTNWKGVLNLQLRNRNVMATPGAAFGPLHGSVAVSLGSQDNSSGLTGSCDSARAPPPCGGGWGDRNGPPYKAPPAARPPVPAAAPPVRNPTALMGEIFEVRELLLAALQRLEFLEHQMQVVHEGASPLPPAPGPLAGAGLGPRP